MTILLAAILLIEYFISIRNKRSLVHPATLFLLLWAIVVLFASFRFYDMNRVSFSTLLVIFCGVNSFVLGATVRFKGEHNNTGVYMADTGCVYTFISEKTYWIIFFFVFALLIPEIRETFDLLERGYTLDRIRSARLGVDEISGFISVYGGNLSSLLAYVRWGFQTILVAAGIELFFVDYKKHKKHLFASIILCASESLIEGGRWTIVYLLVEFMVCYLFFRRNYGFSYFLSKTAKRTTLIVVILTVTGFIYITNMRINLSFDKLIGQLYYYFCGCVPLLDARVSIIDSTSTISFGFSGLYGLFYLLMMVLSSLLHVSLPFVSQVTKEVFTEQTALMVGQGRSMNAFVTSFYVLYADFRHIGVILGMFLFGALSGALYRRCFNTDRNNSIVPYMICSQLIIKSIQVYPLSNVKIVVMILLLISINAFSNNMDLS